MSTDTQGRDEGENKERNLIMWNGTPKISYPHRLISPEPNSGCWLWLGTVNNKGYGSLAFREGGTVVSRPVHRIVYEQHKGIIPAGLQLDHLCRVPCCVNPDHLEPVTASENLRRGAASRGPKSHCKNGHALVPGSFYQRGRRRKCKACFSEIQKRYLARKKQRAGGANV